jgi:hypothetical protein
MRGLPCEFATLTASRIVKEQYLIYLTRGGDTRKCPYPQPGRGQRSPRAQGLLTRIRINSFPVYLMIGIARLGDNGGTKNYRDRVQILLEIST